MINGIRWIIRVMSGVGYLFFLAISEHRLRALALILLAPFVLGVAIFVLILSAYAREEACAECHLPTDTIQLIQK